ncbi:MAG TPA: hypothetical protein PLD59_10230 [Tepidisphaeraceae bacterium]|nr:hypothetical protein [Tepidisphaeraceae bacterium]
MRELEFLPKWYPTFRRRRRLLATQIWASVTIVAALGLLGISHHQRVYAQSQVNAGIVNQITQTRTQLVLLDEQLALKAQLSRQSAILAEVGLQVDFTRIIGDLDQLMGPDMFLIDFSAQTEEQTRSAPAVSANKSNQGNSASSFNKASAAKVDRNLKIKLVAVSPSDVDVANFLSGLTNKPCFDQVAMTYAKDRVQGGRLMREFELTFLINLNSPSTE